MNKNKKCLVIFIISLILLNISIIFATNSNKYNKEKYFRIHIVANSDSIDDQLLKYTIAKKVNQYIENLTSSSTTKEMSKKLVYSNLEKIENICYSVIESNKLNYNVKIYIGDIYYDKKTKNNITMKEGIYDSLKIVIGNGDGENFWSLIYPSSINTNNNCNYEEFINNDNIEFTFGIKEILKEILHYFK